MLRRALIARTVRLPPCSSPTRAGESRLSKGSCAANKNDLKGLPIRAEAVMTSLIAIFREVRDPRDLNARHDLAAMLFIALASTLCGARSCVDIADSAAANEDSLAEIASFRRGPSRQLQRNRLLDPEEMAGSKEHGPCPKRWDWTGAARWRWTARACVSLRAGPRLHACAHDQRLGRRNAPVPRHPPCARRRRDRRDPGGAENRDAEGLHNHRRRLALPSGHGRGRARQRRSLRPEAQGQPRAAPQQRRQGVRGR